MYSEILVSGPRPGAAGAVAQRGSKDGHQVVMDGHSKYLQAALDGNLYNAANALGTPVTTQAGLSATTPAFTLYNPVGSGKIGVLLQFGYSLNAAPAAAAFAALAKNKSTAAAPTATTNAGYLGNVLSQTQTGAIQAFAIATLATAPVACYYLGGVTGASGLTPAVFDFNIDGKLVIMPGEAVSFQTSAAMAVVCHALWEEVPLSMVT